MPYSHLLLWCQLIELKSRAHKSWGAEGFIGHFIDFPWDLKVCIPNCKKRPTFNELRIVQVSMCTSKKKYFVVCILTSFAHYFLEVCPFFENDM